MTTQTTEGKSKYVYRGTNKQKGRSISVSPENSSMKHLQYGRIILDDDVRTVEFDTGKCEVGLIVLDGQCSIDVDGQENTVGRYDSIYIPRDSQVVIATNTQVDLAECSAEVANRYPLRVVRYDDVKDNGSLSLETRGRAKHM